MKLQKRKTPFPGDCAECEQPLNSYDIKHGWVSVEVGWRRPPVRVHTICRRKFQERQLEDQQARGQAQWDAL